MKAPSTKHQAPNFKKLCRNRRVVWNLKFGISLALGAWILELFTR
jgi:hypothetical protein